MSGGEPRRTLVARNLSEVRTRRQLWAARDLIPVGVLTILAGRGGIGKSTILAWITAQLSRGLLPGDFAGTPVSVGLICGEDDPATTLVPRLRVAGADMTRVVDLSTVVTEEDDGTTWNSLPTLATDLAAMRDVITERGIRILIIDPVLSTMNGDTNKAPDVRRNLDPLASLAAELGIAVILVQHFGKGSGDASDKLSGSHAFRDIARSVLLLAIDDETDDRILTVDKNNLSPRLPSFVFRVNDETIETDDGYASTVGRAELLGETALTVQALLDRDRPVSERTMDVIALLASTDGPLEPKDVAASLGIDPKAAAVSLSRLVKSGQARRTARGKYTSNTNTPGVVSDSSDATDTTPTTLTAVDDLTRAS